MKVQLLSSLFCLCSYYYNISYSLFWNFCAFWVMFGGPQSASLPPGSAKKDLSTIYHVAVMAFRMSLVDSYPYDVSSL